MGPGSVYHDALGQHGYSGLALSACLLVLEMLRQNNLLLVDKSTGWELLRSENFWMEKLLRSSMLCWKISGASNNILGGATHPFLQTSCFHESLRCEVEAYPTIQFQIIVRLAPGRLSRGSDVRYLLRFKIFLLKAPESPFFVGIDCNTANVPI